MNPKKTLYNIHKAILPGPESAKWLVPLAAIPLAYGTHKLFSKGIGKGIQGLGSVMHKGGLKVPGAITHRFGGDLQKSNPLLFTAAMTALAGAISHGVYRPGATDDKREMENWENWFYPEKIAMDKEAAFDPLMTASAGLQQGWGHDSLIDAEIKRHKWMTPSVDARRLKENIWDTPGFTSGQKTFLRDSVDGAMQTANNPELLSMNDLGIGTQRAIVNKAEEVPSLLGTAIKATARGAEGAFIGRGLGVMLGGKPSVVNFLQNTGLAVGVLNTSDVMKKVKSYF